MASLDIGIIGGGPMGLALGYRLSRVGHRVTVFEQAEQFGGLATHHDYGPFCWDRFYHVVLPTDTELIEFLREIGMADALGWRSTQTGVFLDGQMFPMNNAIDFLRFPPLSAWSKLRLGWMLHRAPNIDDWRGLEQLTAEDWLCATCGRQTFEKFWKPLLVAKLGEQYRRVSAVFIWSYIKRLASARQSTAKREQLGYISGGYQAVFARILDSIRECGGAALHSTPVRRVDATAGGGISVVTDEEVRGFDKVIFTAPTNALAHVVDHELAALDGRGESVEYLGVVCLALVTRQPLLPYYTLNIADTRIPFTGVIGISNVVPTTETNDLHLTFLPKYLSSDDRVFRQTDEEIGRTFLAGLGRMLPNYESSNVVSIHVNRATKVQPLQTIGYSQIVPQCRTLHPDFFVLNTSQFLFGTLNNNAVIGAVNRFMRDHASRWTSHAAAPVAASAASN